MLMCFGGDGRSQDEQGRKAQKKVVEGSNTVFACKYADRSRLIGWQLAQRNAKKEMERMGATLWLLVNKLNGVG